MKIVDQREVLGVTPPNERKKHEVKPQKEMSGQTHFTKKATHFARKETRFTRNVTHF